MAGAAHADLVALVRRTPGRGDGGRSRSRRPGSDRGGPPLGLRRRARARTRAGRHPSAFAAPSFVSTAATWCSAVRGETTSRSAISAFVSPPASSDSTSSWRAVSPAGFARVDSRGPRGTLSRGRASAARRGGRAARRRARGRSRSPLRATPRRRAARASARGRRPSRPRRSVGRGGPVAAHHRREDGGDAGSSSRGRSRRPRPRPRRARAPQPVRPPRGSELFASSARSARRHRAAAGQRPLDASSSTGVEPLELACAIGLLGEVGEPLGGVRIAPPDGELGRARSSRAAADGRCRARSRARATRSASSHSPRAEPQPRERHRDVGDEVVHLVLLGVGERLLGVAPRRLAAAPSPSACSRGCRAPARPRPAPRRRRATACASSSVAASSGSS